VTDAVAAAWLEVLGALVSDAAHTVNNLLNDAAINLSAVAGRLSSPKVVDSTGEALAARTVPFATHAGHGLDAASELVQSMMGLARPLPTPVDPHRMVAQIIRVAAAGSPKDAPEVGVELQDPVLDPENAALGRLAIAAGVRTLAHDGVGGTVRWVGSNVALARPVGARTGAILSKRVLQLLILGGRAVRSEADVVSFSL
jgi:hypothetical protein